MKYTAISGSWRHTPPAVEHDVTARVAQIMEEGNGIVTGGALGVDYLATSIAIDQSASGKQLQVILPTSLDTYSDHYRKKAAEDVISSEQAELLITQLQIVNLIGSLVEMGGESVDKESYYLRNNEVINRSDSLLAFQVNGSAGVGDAISKAHQKAIPVQVFPYEIQV